MSNQSPPKSSNTYTSRVPRPRALPTVPQSPPELEDPLLKKRSVGTSRVIPTSVIISTVFLSFLIFAIVLTRNVGTVVVSHPSSLSATSPASSSSTDDARSVSAPTAPVVQLEIPVGTDGNMPRRRAQSSGPVDAHSMDQAPVAASNVDPHAENRVDAPPPQSDKTSVQMGGPKPPLQQGAASSMQASANGVVSWNRSWPLTEADDVTGLLPLANSLKFTNMTMLNYFHLHKTGGVTTKSQVRELLLRPENMRQMTKRGQPMGVTETCYRAISPASSLSLSVREVNWRCDFGQIKEFDQSTLRGLDIVMGHQYWQNGCDYYFGHMRNVQYFSIFRHPLARKLSFFYHFFVRNSGLEEKSIPREDVLKFVLAEDLSADPRSRDSGPNYFASRFMSNGITGFSRNQYPIEQSKQDEIIADILNRLDTRYAFVGLQLHNDASQCMLEKAVQVLAHAHGIDTLVGSTKLGVSTKRLNSGEYPWSARKLWDSMSKAEKDKFNEVERVDLAIYRKATERFVKDVKLFGCEQKVEAENWDEDVFE